MNAEKPGALLLCLSLALVTALLAAGAAGQSPAEASLSASVAASAAGSVAASSPSQSPAPLPTASLTPPPTSSPITSPIATSAEPGRLKSPTASADDSSASTSTPAHAPTPTSAHAPTSALESGTSLVLGTSVEGRPIVAHRVGEGPLKVVLVGNIHGAFEDNTYELVRQLADQFLAHPEQVPANVSLWLIPTMNPDGLATDHRWNASEVDLNRNADTDLDGCAGNDWSPDTIGREGVHEGAGGAYPFSEPESRAVRDFLKDAWIAVFYHSAADAIYEDTCQRHIPTARLAQVLSEGTGYPVPEEGWAGYPITGDFADYLAGEGVAAVTVELTDHEDPQFDRNLEGVRQLLAAADEVASAEATDLGAEFVWLDEENTGVLSFASGTFLHPLALEVIGDRAYLLDGGRVLALDLNRPEELHIILGPGDDVEAVRVLEPLDLAADGGGSLLVLDRAGDVYRFDPALETWTLERYGRPAGDTNSHYYVALAADEGSGYLLETTFEQVWRFNAGQQGSAWISLPQSRDVDLSARDQHLYVLTRGMNSPLGNLFSYLDGRQVPAFQPNLALMHPRQVVADEESVHVLDRDGRRLLTLEGDGGALQTLRQFRDRRAASALWADPDGERIVLAGPDTVYFLGEPQRSVRVDPQADLRAPQAHNLALLEGLRGLTMPIEGARLTQRDFQMPGAPRHYRLGVHEGIDFYGHTVGVPVSRQTEVRAVADGIIVRALTDYVPLTGEQAAAWAAMSREAGYTPAEVLDGYRGRQVWIDHGGGVVSRYAHLGAIAPGIVEGAQVAQGQAIGTVGNSGTPSSVQSQTEEVHLHLELWVGEHFVGQFLRPIEAREWLERILR